MIKRFIVCLSLFCFLTVNQVCLASEILIPANTSIYLSPINTVTSKDMNVDNVEATIMEDVVINKTLVFRAGDKASLHIGENEKARCLGKGGKPVISNGYAYDVKGVKHKILLSRNFYEEDKTWPKTCGVVSIFFLWPLALTGFVHGGQATVFASLEIETSLASQFYFEK